VNIYARGVMKRNGSDYLGSSDEDWAIRIK